MMATTDIRFDGKVALVTGAGRGLGRAYALDLASRGAHVVVNDANFDLSGQGLGAATPAQDVVAQIVAAGGDAIAHSGNVADPADAQGMVEAAIARWGRIDIVVNNAGQMRKLTFSQSSLADFNNHFQVHVGGSYLVSRAAWPHMVAQGSGAIVLTTSQVGMYGQLDAAAYGAAKMGVMGLLHAMKLEGQAHGIRVNAIAPFALTRMGEGTFPEAMRAYIDPTLVAPAVTWMVSDQCDWNGEILIAGGGHFACARVSETLGIDFDDPSEIRAELINERQEEIAEVSGALRPDDALGAVQVTFARLTRLSRAT